MIDEVPPICGPRMQLVRSSQDARASETSVCVCMCNLSLGVLGTVCLHVFLFIGITCSTQCTSSHHVRSTSAARTSIKNGCALSTWCESLIAPLVKTILVIVVNCSTLCIRHPRNTFRFRWRCATRRSRLDHSEFSACAHSAHCLRVQLSVWVSNVRG